MPVSFLPDFPEDMPEAFIKAAKNFHKMRGSKTRNAWGRSRFKRGTASSENTPEALSNPTEEELLYLICASREYAAAARKLDELVGVPPKFWRSVLYVGVSFREQIRITDKRTKAQRIEKLKKTKEALEVAADLLASESYGRLLPGIRAGELDHPGEPFNQQLLSDEKTMSFHISGNQKGNNKTVPKEFRFIGTLNIGSVSEANRACAERISSIMSEIIGDDSIPGKRRAKQKERELRARREAWKLVFFQLMEAFSREFPTCTGKRFYDARYKVIRTIMIAALRPIEGEDFEAELKRIADEWRKKKKAACN